MKVILNKCYGGWGVSVRGHIEYYAAVGYASSNLFCYNIDKEKLIKIEDADKPGNENWCLVTTDDKRQLFNNLESYKLATLTTEFRFDPILISLIEKCGSEFMSAPNSNLEIEEYEVRIRNYDGKEFLE